MKNICLVFTFLFSMVMCAQNDFLAKQYFNNNEFEKAVVFYEKLVETNPGRADYTEGLIRCYQQLERYSDAENILTELLKDEFAYPTFYIEQGYNYTLQNKPTKATEYYNKALKIIEENPNYGYAIGLRFQKYVLLEYASNALLKAMELNPTLDYNFQLASIYGEQGDILKMFSSYLTLIAERKVSASRVLRYIDPFLTDDATNENNLNLKKLLLQNAQQNPDPVWNELLSWLFTKQKQFGAAFRQEKAIFKRTNGVTIGRLNELGQTTLENNDPETTLDIYNYIIDTSQDPIVVLDAQLKLIDIELTNATPKQYNSIEKKFEDLISNHGYKNSTLQLQVAYANFLTFTKNTPEPAIAMLKKCLVLPLNTRSIALIKMTLADILVFNQQFNAALIYYTQVQQSLKNDILGQNARFKVAQTSFYKGDFKWALTQLKVLRSSTSQLIANDAMQLSLLISDNTLQDSTQTALRKYANADLLAYQNKDNEAMAELTDILENHKGEKIEDEALLKQAQLLQKAKRYEEAEFNYIKIVEFYTNGILADDALFALGELYRTVLNKPQLAMQQYEKIIFNHQDSYFFPQARRYFRTLRGDKIN